MKHRPLLITIGLTTAVVAATAAAIVPAYAAGPGYFGYVANNNSLPSSEQCASWVGSQWSPENKGANRWFNGNRGYRLSGATGLMARVDGNFTGTTEQILRWGACKWGVDENAVKAQAVVESWWHQDNRGAAHGILQVQQGNNQWAYPGVSNSTAMNVDYALARWRECESGYWTWLNDVERGWNYGPHDGWGCVGVWGTGRWHTWQAEQYIRRVIDAQQQQTWRSRNCQQG
jgi:hypothetical protein